MTRATYELPDISLRMLLAEDPVEGRRLLDACQSHGFFTLNLSEAPAHALLADYQCLLAFMRAYFTQPMAKKMLDARFSDTNGYEPVGTSAGVFHGEADGYESLKVSRSEMLVCDESLPNEVKQQFALFQSSMTTMHSICLVILEALSGTLGDDACSCRFQSSHDDSMPSKTTLSMFRYPARDVSTTCQGHNQHTDLGSLTLLFSEQRGLQIRPPGSESWYFVEPRSDRIVVNVGDSLRFLSDQKLLSCVHRVLPVREDIDRDRYSIAYFLRAADHVLYKDSRGRYCSAEQWHNEKFDHFRVSHEEQAAHGSMLLGGMEKFGGGFVS